MDEKTIGLINSLGYNYVSGFIVDKNGNYVESITNPDTGESVTTGASQEDFEEYFNDVDNQKDISQAFKDEGRTNPFPFASKYEDVLSTTEEGNDYIEQELARSQDTLNNYIQRPMEEIEPEDNEYTTEALNRWNEEHPEEQYNSLENLLFAKNEGSVYSRLEKEKADRLKNINKGLENIHKIDPDTYSTRESVMESLAKDKKDDNWFLGTMKSGVIGLESLQNQFTRRGSGMQNEALKKAYLGLLEEKRTILKPVAESQLEKVNFLEEVLNKTLDSYPKVGRGHLPTAPQEEGVVEIMAGLDALKYQKDNLTDFIEDKDFNSHILTQRNLNDFTTFGISEVYYNTIKNKLADKKNSREELNKGEMLLAEVYGLEHENNSYQFEPTFWNKATDGLNTSFKFVGQMGLAGGAAGNVTKFATGGVKYTGFASYLKEGADFALMPLFQPSTYSQAFQHKAGEFVPIEDKDGNIKILAGQRLYKETINKATEDIIELQNAKKQFLADGDEEKVKEIEGYIKQTQEDMNAYEPYSWGESLFKSYMTNFYEDFSEIYGGKIVMGALKAPFKLSGKVAKKFIKSPKLSKIWKKRLIEDPINRFKKIDNFGSGLKGKFNNAFGSGRKLMGSQTEEMAEEVFVQFMPNYREDYGKQLEELTNPEFYKQVMAITGGMTSVFGGLQVIQKGAYNYFMSADDKEKKKALLEYYKALKKSNISDEDMERLLMSGGNGDFSITTYQNNIRKLRREGNHKEADRIEMSMFTNQAIEAQRLGVLDKFKSSLTRSLYNKNLSPSTIRNIEQTLEYAKSLEEDSKYINGNDVINKRANLRFYNNVILHNKEELENVDMNKVEASFEKLKKKFGITDLSFEDFKKEGFANHKEARAHTRKHFESFSKDFKAYALASSQISIAEKNVEGIEKEVERITSKKYQKDLHNENLFKEKLNNYDGDINSEEEIDKAFDNILKNNKVLARQLDKDRLENMKRNIKDNFNKIEAFRKAAEEVEDTPVEKTPHQQTVSNVADEVVIKKENKDLTKESYPKVEETPPETANTGEEIKTPPKGLKDGDVIADWELPEEEETTIKNYYNSFKMNNNRPPTFNDLIEELQDEDIFEDFTKGDLTDLAESWEKAGYGNVNVDKIWNKYFASEKKALNRFAKLFKTRKKNVSENKEAKETNEHQPSPTKIKDPVSGEVREKTFTEMQEEEVALELQNSDNLYARNINKTVTVDPKGHYSSVEYEEVEEKDGKITIRYRKDKDKRPKLRTDYFLNLKTLLQPFGLKEGDKLQTEIVDENTPNSSGDGLAWDEILTFSIDPKTGEKTRMTFSEWVSLHKPKDMSLEKFKTTEEYMLKVPITYNVKGKPVMFVGDMAWYNSENVPDPDIEPRMLYPIVNTSEAHKKFLLKGQAMLFHLRKKILSGEILEVEIGEITQSPYTYIDMEEGELLPSLLEIDKTSRIVTINNAGRLLDMNGDEIDTEEDITLTNRDWIYDNNITGTFYLSPNGFDKNGKQAYIGFKVYNYNEQGKERAFESDIETAKIILSANAVLNGIKKTKGYPMSMDEAKALEEQIETTTGLKIGNYDNALRFVNSMIRIADGVGIHLADAKKISMDGVIGNFREALFSNASNIRIHQNTNNHPLAMGITVAKGSDGKYTVEKPFEVYEDFVRSRVQTNIMSYNVGTEEKPLYTHRMQPSFYFDIELEADTESKEFKDAKAKEQKEKIDKVETVEDIEEDTSIEATEEADKIADEAIDLLDKYNLLDKITNHFDLSLPEIVNEEALLASINSIPGISYEDQQDIILNLVARIVATYRNKNNKSVAQIHQEAVTKGLKKSLIEVRAELEAVASKVEGIEHPQKELITKQLKAGIETTNVVEANIDQLFTIALKEASNSRLISEVRETVSEIDEILEDEELYVKDFSKSSNEVVHKDKVSKKLKRVFATLPMKETGFLGEPKRAGFNTVYNTVLSLLTNPLPGDASFEDMIAVLTANKDKYDFIPPLIDKLLEEDSEVREVFVSDMYKYPANAIFAVFGDIVYEDFSGTQRIRTTGIWDSNSNNIYQSIRTSWIENFKNSELVVGEYINKNQAKKLYDEFKSWNPKTVPKNVVRRWLSDFGIVLSDRSWNDFVSNRMKNNKNKTLIYTMMFSKGGLLNEFANYAKAMEKSKGKLNYVENEDYNLFKHVGSQIKGLIKLEQQYNLQNTSMSRRSGDKTVSEFVLPNFFMDMVKALKSGKYTKQLLKDSFSKNSNLLNLLINNENVRRLFNYREVDINALKERFVDSDNKAFNKVEDLSELDYILLQRVLHQNTRQEAIKVQANKINMRMGYVSTLTNSDKGRMMVMNVPVFDLFSSEDAITFDEKGNPVFSQDLKLMLWDRLIMPEVERILSNNKPNIKGYEEGKKRFNLLPYINDITIDGVTAQKYLNTKGVEVKDFKVKYFKAIINELSAGIKEEASNSLNTIEQEEIEVYGSEFLKKRKTKDNKLLAAELDYTINYMIGNMEAMQLLVGDPAMFYKKNKKSKTEIEISQDLDINLGKRLALMLAPGRGLEGSKGEKYIQIFMKDNVDMGVMMDRLIQYYYGEDELERVIDGKTIKTHIDEKNITLLKDLYGDVADFFEIETTDAQEYTTLKEHLRVMWGLGIITRKEADRLYKRRNKLTKEETSLVLQPLKPVYTGIHFDGDGIRRTVYIKSSSFPLIPELVNGTHLEPLMKKMEEIEKKHKMYNVRASYQTANKVGSVTNPINILDTDDLTRLDKLEGTLLLDREYFRIQQDVPYKLTNKVSMGTQIFKILFGSGINDISGFMYKGKPYTGSGLREIFFEKFNRVITMQMEKFLDELGVNRDFSNVGSKEYFEKLRNLLVKEAESRNFNPEDIKVLGLTVDNNGNTVFNMPLWLSANSDKFEALLNSLIKNRILKQKYPGNKLVVGSENGFQLRSQENLGESEVVYVDNYRGGELQDNEALVTSKIIYEGETIDLFEKKDNGDYRYLIKNEDKSLTINENSIDPEILNHFVFRTPTSSHGSAKSIKIVGFIPSIMGDLIITSKNLITQLGQDFDIDTLTSYQYHIMKDKDGNLVKLSQENREEYIDHLNEVLDDIKQQIEDGKYLPTRDHIIINNLIGGIFDVRDFDLFTEKRKVQNEIRKSFEEKILQNDIIEIYHSVYNNEDPKVQKKIRKVLSMDYALKQKENISSLVAGSKNKYFSTLSPTYQMNKLRNASTGAKAIGIYAKVMNFHNLASQSNSDISLIRYDKESKSIINEDITIGHLMSKGFGQNNVVMSSPVFQEKNKIVRTIADVVDERVNTGTDAEKAQVLGNVGLTNTRKIAVDGLLVAQGINIDIQPLKEDGSDYDENTPFHRKKKVGDKWVYYKEMDVSYLLSSQPLVMEFFKRLENGASTIKGFNKQFREDILDELFGGAYYEYKSGSKPSRFTGEFLESQLKSSSNSTQKDILHFYLQLMDKAEQLKDINSIVDLNDIGISMWELQDKIDKFKELQGNTNISNVASLLGEFVDGKFVPTTAQGSMVGATMELGENLFYHLFPYTSPTVVDLVDKIISKSNKKDDDANIDFKYKIFQEIKKFLMQSESLGIFKGNVAQNRKELLSKDNGNTPLGTYINYLKTLDLDNVSEEERAGINSLKNNSFFQNLNTKTEKEVVEILFEINNNTFPDSKYTEAFKAMLANNLPLPNKNGKAYSTQMLAQELITYSFLVGGNVKKARQFHHLIPFEYYSMLETNPIEEMRSLHQTLLQGGWEKVFFEQFFQHNPQYVTGISSKKLSKNGARIKNNVLAFDKKRADEFIVVRNNKGKLKQDKYRIFKNSGDNINFEEIPVLGNSSSIGEYNREESPVSTSLYKDYSEVNTKKIVLTQNRFKPAKTRSFKVGKTVKETLGDIALNSKVKKHQIIAKALADLLPDTAFNSTIVIDKALPSNGKYQDGVMYLRNDSNETTFIHEFIHSITSPEIDKWLDENDNVIEGASAYMVSFQILVNEYKNQLLKDEATKEEYKKFLDKLDKYGKEAADTGSSKITFTEKEKTLYYPATNIKEFLAVMFSENREGLLEEAGKMEYKKSGFTIVEKFKQIMNKFFATTYNRETTLADHLFSSGMELIEKINTRELTEAEKTLKELKEIEDNSKESETPKVIDSPVGKRQDILFVEEPTTGYRNRTIKNAKADATIAIASDFNSAGEKLTKKSVEGQNKKYISINIKDNLVVTEEIVEEIVKQLNFVEAKTLNIAGNGIYTFKGQYTQEEVDAYVFDLLYKVLNNNKLTTKIESIRSGGQTGIDEAGVKAAQKLEIKSGVLAPKGWKFRDVNGKDISDEKLFKARFKQEDKTQESNTKQEPKAFVSASKKDDSLVDNLNGINNKPGNVVKLISYGNDFYGNQKSSMTNTSDYQDGDTVFIISSNESNDIADTMREVKKTLEVNVKGFIFKADNILKGIMEKELGEDFTFVEAQGLMLFKAKPKTEDKGDLELPSVPENQEEPFDLELPGEVEKVVESRRQKLESFVKGLGFSVDIVDDMVSETGYDILSATDLLHKSILLSKENSTEAFTKEVAYIVLEMLGNKNIFKKDLINNIHLLDDYKKRLAKYENSKVNEYVKRKLVAVDYLQELLQSNFITKPSKTRKSKDIKVKNKLDYLILKIKVAWEKFKRKFLKNYNKAKANDILNQIANDVVASNYALYNTSIKDTKIYKILENEDIKEDLFDVEKQLDNNPKFKKVFDKLNKIGFIVSGSLALAKQGTLYRSKLNDLDFTVPYKLLKDNKYLKLLKDNFEVVETNTPYPGIYGSRVFTMTVKLDGVTVDLFLPVEEEYANSLKVLNGNIQDWESIFDAKVRIGSKKHLKDLINFKPYLQSSSFTVGQRHYNFDVVYSPYSYTYKDHSVLVNDVDINVPFTKDSYEETIVNTAKEYFSKIGLKIKDNTVYLKNGERSRLFETILNYHKEDFDKAIVDYWKTYSENFKAFYGNLKSRQFDNKFQIGNEKLTYSKNSIFVDSNGEPIIQFHGTGTDFDTFSKDYFLSGEGAMAYGAGFYGTNHKPTAEQYAITSQALQVKIQKLIEEKDKVIIDFLKDHKFTVTELQLKLSRYLTGSNPNIKNGKSKFEVLADYLGLHKTKYLYVAITNPLYWSSEVDKNSLYMINKHFNSKYKNITGGDLYRSLQSDYKLEDKELSSILYGIGVDGTIHMKRGGTAAAGFKHLYGEVHFVAFEPLQLKDVHNTGLFSKNNANTYDPIEVEKVRDNKDLTKVQEQQINNIEVNLNKEGITLEDIDELERC